MTLLILNKLLSEIERCVDNFISVVWTLLREKTDSAVRSAQERLSAVWNLAFELPGYQSPHLGTKPARNSLPALLSDYLIKDCLAQIQLLATSVVDVGAVA